MKRVTYEDKKGRKYLAEVENGAPEEEYYLFPKIGPPEGVVDLLELPEPFATRLHNLLYDRKLWSTQEIRKQPKALLGALQAALKIDVQTLHSAYVEYEKEPE